MIPYWVLLDLCSLISGPVCAIFNSSTREGYTPNLWKSVDIVSHIKIQTLKDISEDVRPTALMAKHHIHANQYGAVKGSSTCHALVDMLHHWHIGAENCQTSWVLLLDYSKTFDLVDHNIIIAKLAAYGVPDILLRWVGSFLGGRCQRTHNGQEVSSLINDTVIERVKSSKLLAIIISDDLKLHHHVDLNCSKSSHWIHFLTWLRRSGMEHVEFVQYYTSVIRTVLEYACPVWFTSVKHTCHMWELKLIQIRSSKIIFPELSYKEAVIQFNLCTLEVRLTKLCANFYNNMQNESHRLHYLLPETDSRRKLRHTRKYEPPKCRTEHFKHSFVTYSLFDFL